MNERINAAGATAGDQPQSGPVPMSSSLARRRARLFGSASVAALLAASIAGGTLLLARDPAQASAPPVTGTVQAGQMSIADLVEQVKPAVVAVKVNIRAAADRADGTPFAIPGIPKGSPFERFFKQFEDQYGQAPRGLQQQPLVQAQGSGFFISEDGYIVTNNHVVDHAANVQITLDDGRTLDAKVIGTDAKTDLALLKADAAGPYKHVTLARTAPRVGETVVAIGNPFGLGGTVTSGIISARGRDIGAGPYDDFLQVDAAVNRGNSGGPTFNLRGEVVGVNTAIYSPSGGSVGIGFAIPSETVASVVAQLKDHGNVERGYLGVRTQSVTSDVADSLSLKQAQGALIDSAEQGTPAAKAGLKAGDIITAVNGTAIHNARELARRIGGMKPGSKVEVSYLRDGKTLTTTLELGALPSGKTAKASPADTGKAALAGLGLQLAPATSVQGAGEEGVAVVDVDPNGAAARKGMRDGDVILEVGGKAVSTPSQVSAGIDKAKTDGRTAVLMKVKSADGTRFVAVPVPKA